jgi:hypothetical protein
MNEYLSRARHWRSSRGSDSWAVQLLTDAHDVATRARFYMPQFSVVQTVMVCT